MVNRIILYYHTLKSMKPSQVIARIRIKLGKANPLGVAVRENVSAVHPIDSPVELDFDPEFLYRFPVEQLMQNKVTFLHSSKDINWKIDWNFTDKSALWNFNLHYFEYLLPLVKAYQDSGDKKYLEKTEEIIGGWIETNPVGNTPAWASYTIAMRMVTWICYYRYVEEELSEEFKKKFLLSLHVQYDYLSKHLEKDILGNHYFEDLKSLLLASLFFNDEAVFQKVLREFKAECKEEILSDGMHFELSPMYHKIIFEGMLRVALALRSAGKKDEEIESYLQPMLDVAYSFEDGLDRLPLFNDGGNNVAKSLNALVSAAKCHYNLTPRFRGQLKDSGFYIFNKEIGGHSWRLVVDAGQPGPKYIPGHAHCDAMSFELFRDGKPVVVNCGTYAYQCKERAFFRSTAAHNTVMINGVEQSQCWGTFRLAKRSSVKVIQVDNNSICLEMTDQKASWIRRQISFADSLVITDKTDGKKMDSFLHFIKTPEQQDNMLHCHDVIVYYGDNIEVKLVRQQYAEDYGLKQEISAVRLVGKGTVSYQVSLR